MIEFRIKPYRGYKHVVVDIDSVTVQIGMLNEEEAKNLAIILRNTADELHDVDTGRI